MNYGLYLSATGALSSLHRQDVLANNLANAETVGFKPDLVFTRQRPPERLENPGAFVEPQWLLEQLGGGHFVEPTRAALSRQGAMTATGNTLDLAIEGEGLLVVAGNGTPGPADLRFTRDGRLGRNAAGELIMTSSGLRVLDQDLAPIRLAGTGAVEVRHDGTIMQGDRVLATLRVVAIDARDLTKAGANLFRLSDDAAAQRGTQRGGIPAARDAAGVIRQGFVEGSAVDPIMALHHMTAASRAVEANMRLMQYQDFIMGQAINTFARVA
jgi:flagellar basal body rod protein FlgG